MPQNEQILINKVSDFIHISAGNLFFYVCLHLLILYIDI